MSTSRSLSLSLSIYIYIYKTLLVGTQGHYDFDANLAVLKL